MGPGLTRAVACGACTQHGVQYATIFLKLLCNVTKESSLCYILQMVADMLDREDAAVAYFHACHNSGPDIAPYDVCLRLLNRQDEYVKTLASQFLTRLFVTAKEPIAQPHSTAFVRWLADALAPSVVADWSQSVVGDLQKLLRLRSLRVVGHENRLAERQVFFFSFFWVVVFLSGLTPFFFSPP